MLLDLWFHHTYEVSKVSVKSSVSGGKLHIAELYAQKQQIELDNLIAKQDDDLITLIGYMIVNRVIT